MQEVDLEQGRDPDPEDRVVQDPVDHALEDPVDQNDRRHPDNPEHLA